MTISCYSQVALHYVGGGSDKLYVLQLLQEVTPAGLQYMTMGYYGRRGSPLRKHEIYKGTNFGSAKTEYDKKVREQRSQGYLDYSFTPGTAVTGMPPSAPIFGAAAGSATPVSVPAASTGYLPMKAKAISFEQALTCIANQNYAAQQQFDGERVTVSVRRNAIVGFNGKGASVTLPAGVHESLKPLLARTDFQEERETVLDGQVIGDDLIIYDAIILRDNDIRDVPYHERYAALELLLESAPHLLADTAWTEAEKQSLRDKGMASGWDGLIYRHLDMPYASGNSTDATLKANFWAEATCRVMTMNLKREIGLGMIDEHGNEVEIGRAHV